MSSFINPIMPFTSFVVKQYIIIIIIPVPHKNVGIGEFCEGSAPFLLDIKQKAGWLVDIKNYGDTPIACKRIIASNRRQVGARDESNSCCLCFRRAMKLVWRSHTLSQKEERVWSV